MRPGTSRSGTSPASTLMPREKTVLPQGSNRNLGAPSPPAIDHRDDGALPRSQAAAAPVARHNKERAASAARAPRLTGSRGGAADGEAVDAHGGLADADRHA